MGLVEVLAVFGFFLTHGAKIFKFFCRLTRVLFAWFRLQGVRISVLFRRKLSKKSSSSHGHKGHKSCQGWDCDHWEVLKTKDGSIALQHRDLEVWQRIRELDFYIERYQQFGIPVPANVHK